MLRFVVKTTSSVAYRHSPLPVQVLRLSKVRSFSTDPRIESDSQKTHDVLVYEGIFGRKMKWLRRISLGSSVLSTIFLPVAVTVQSGVLPMAAQIAIAGTVFFSSVSSTALLQVVAHPYVCTLHEVLPVPADGTIPFTDLDGTSSTSPSPSQLDRRFKAMRYNFLGKPVVTEFSLKQADRNVSNPFSSFQVKPAGYFYIYGGEIKDPVVRRALTRES